MYNSTLKCVNSTYESLLYKIIPCYKGHFLCYRVPYINLFFLHNILKYPKRSDIVYITFRYDVLRIVCIVQSDCGDVVCVSIVTAT